MHPGAGMDISQTSHRTQHRTQHRTHDPNVMAARPPATCRSET